MSTQGRAQPLRTAAPRVLAFALLATLPRVHAAEVVAPPVLPDPGTWLPRPVAELRVLDKVGAGATPMVLSVGQAAPFHSLTVTLRACAVRPPELPPDSAAFLDITDSHEGQPGFHGWMFSGEPQIAMLENPLYDVHLMSCRAEPAAPPTAGAPAAPPPARAPR